MNTECTRIAQELASTIDGEAWYGDSLREILAGVPAKRAAARPIPHGHSIWEILVHVDAWIVFFFKAMGGTPIPPWPSMPHEVDWPPVHDADERSWQQCLRSFFDHHAEFIERLRSFGDERLETTVPGRSYDFRRMFHSASLHAAYHAGQIALLKKMLA
jgi:hypothetical protein